MPLLPRRYERLKAVLDRRMGDLTVLLEQVEKPHNLSAILRSCDAVGVLEAHAVCRQGRLPTFNSTALGSQKWVPLRLHADAVDAITALKDQGLRVYGTHLGVQAVDYRCCDFSGPTAFLLGAEKWGLSDAAAAAIDQAIVIPMHGHGSVAERLGGGSDPALRGPSAAGRERKGAHQRGRNAAGALPGSVVRVGLPGGGRLVPPGRAPLSPPQCRGSHP